MCNSLKRFLHYSHLQKLLISAKLKLSASFTIDGNNLDRKLTAISRPSYSAKKCTAIEVIEAASLTEAIKIGNEGNHPAKKC